jgi:AbrB family looped-hinge helix DNA binding protein
MRSEQVTVSRKYQVVIPRAVREQVKLKAGQQLMVMVKHGMISLVPVLSLDDLQGVFRGMDYAGYREEEDRY